MTGRDIQIKREQLGLSQTEMAKKLGIDRVTLSNWERDVRKLKVRDIIAVKAVFEALRTCAAKGNG